MKKTFLFLAIAAFAIQVNAQTHFSLHAGGAMPIGDFAKYNKHGEKLAISNPQGKEGGAGMGFNVGMKVKFDIPSVEGFGIIATGDFFYNGLNSDYKDDLEKMEDNYECEISGAKYINIPLMVGANYTYNVSNEFGVFGEAAFGVNFRKITNYVKEYDGDEIKQEFDLATTFGFQIGAGVIFNEKFSVGIHYYALGSSKVKGKYSGDIFDEYSYEDDWKASKDDDYGYESDDDSFKKGKLSTGMLAIRIGFHF